MDIALNDNGDGAEVILTGGDLKGDGTLYNAVYLSLFGGDNYSNVFEEYESNGDFEEALNNPITAPNLQNIEKTAKKALEWMLNEKAAESIEVYAHGNIENKIDVEITITEPTGNDYKFAVVWKNQKYVLLRR